MMKNYLIHKVNFAFLYFICLIPLVSNATKMPHYDIQVVTELLEPYQMYNAEGKLDGFATEVVRALFKQANADADIKVMPWSRAYNTALNVKNTMIYSMTRTKEREDKFLWLGELFEEKICYWTLKNSLKNKDELNQLNLKERKFSAPRYSIIAEYLLENNYKNVYYTSNGLQSLEMLFSGRTDYILATEHSLKISVKKLNPDFSTLKRVFKQKIILSPLSIAFNINSDIAVVKHFRKAFLTIKQNGILDKLTKKWHIGKLDNICK